MADTVQSRQKRDLFDIIDKLRSQGTSKYVDLPEIIVCGDQSSGKSSVLEAISGMSFPTKDNLCTRFATELILRRTPDITSCTISIIPDAERSEFEKAELKRFDQTIDSHDLNLGKSVEEAKEAMDLSETKRFSTDILRVELCGPDQPHLTMVDLPGLFSAGDKDQTNEDAKTVKNMVVRHMNRERSIILAVISAKNDFANQQVTTLTRKIDRDGSRTMGLITKPDTLHRGSESEAFYINLAKNRNVKFQLGWHILRNRDYPERSSSAEERNATEQAFFEMHPYSTLEASQLGVASLKPRLSEVLLGQILFQLPGLQDDVEAGIKDCESRLRSMGSARSSLQEQKRYLFGVSNGFTRLMEHAVQGTYGDVFFGDAMKEEGEARRLRAVVQNRLLEFADVMREEGRTRKVIDTEEDVESWTAISRKKYVEEVNQLMRRSRGKELPGTFNPLIIGDLFAKQCTKWKDFTFRCLEDILDATEELINDILEEVAAYQTQPAIRSKINDGMEAIKVDLRAKTTQVLANHVSGHPITYNHYLTDQVRKIQAERREKNLEAMMERIYGENWKTIGSTLSKYGPNPTVVFDNLRHLAEVDMESYASSLAVDYAEAYFKVSIVLEILYITTPTTSFLRTKYPLINLGCIEALH